MRTNLKLLAALLAATAMLLAQSAPASAMAYGQPDGDAHPSGGVLVVDWLDANDQLGTDGTVEPFCSLTLVVPRVAITAAHCVDFLELASPGASVRQVGVTFTEKWAPGTELLYGSLVVSPYRAQGDDLAAVVFAQAVHIDPAVLPAAGQLDGLAADGTLRGLRVQSVGYGSHEPSSGPGGRTFDFPRIPGVRQVATSAVTTLAAHTVNYDQNPAHGFGGGCNGDSGGGVFSGNTIVGVMTDGDAACRAYGVNVRLDTPSARSFLNTLVNAR
jgi:hypothetical protein